MKIDCANIPLKSFGKLMTVGKGKLFCPLANLLSTGNKKLPHTTAIFNMASAHNCPSLALGLCRAYSKGKHVCYAKRSERGYFIHVKPRRNKQKDFWLNNTAINFAWQFLLINALKELPWTALRFNESGDFHTQECINKAEKIATILNRYGIKVYCYTARSDLDYSNIRHLIISGSGFQKVGITNIFRMVEDVKKECPKGWGICAGDCRICNRCQIRGYKTVVARH